MGKRDRPNEGDHRGVDSTTQELRVIRREPTTGETEARLRGQGTLLAFGGLALIIMTVAVAIIWRTGFHTEMPMELGIPLYAFGFGSLLVGGLEYLGRTSRANQLADLAQGKKLENGLLLLVKMLPEEQQRQWYEAYSLGGIETFQATGTDTPRRRQNTGEVLKLRPNTRPRP